MRGWPTRGPSVPAPNSEIGSGSAQVQKGLEEAAMP
jgi:hypothetical protein